MSTFASSVSHVGTITFHEFGNVRVMMMPFLFADPIGTIPHGAWGGVVKRICAMVGQRDGVGYVTIDEASVKAGETHRRPGLHVDGIGPDGRAAAYGGGGGYAARGMFVASSHVGCRVWDKTFHGYPANDGDCSALADQCDDASAIVMQPGAVYLCGSHAVHEALPMVKATKRQFVRVSMPSEAPWHDGYTPSPVGVMPAGPIHPRRDTLMAFRS